MKLTSNSLCESFVFEINSDLKTNRENVGNAK